MTNNVLVKGMNGNTSVTIYDDGTRVLEYPDEGLFLDFPLNVDVRVSERCAFGLNPKTKKSVCDFCHESAKTDGREGDLKFLYNHLTALPLTTEIAIGVNEVTDSLLDLLKKLHADGYIVNATVNQGLIGKHEAILDHIYGLGISYRHKKWGFAHPSYLAPNTVLHVIAGIDDFDEILEIVEQGLVKKILVLGEKDFGFNLGRVALTSENHLKWFRNISKLFGKAVISFDNLALEQLRIKRFFSEEKWEVFHQGEYSIYINAVDGYFAPSSRSNKKTNWRTVDDIELFFHMKASRDD
jgi:hypothetical protein